MPIPVIPDTSDEEELSSQPASTPTVIASSPSADDQESDSQAEEYDSPLDDGSSTLSELDSGQWISDEEDGTSTDADDDVASLVNFVVVGNSPPSSQGSSASESTAQFTQSQEIPPPQHHVDADAEMQAAEDGPLGEWIGLANPSPDGDSSDDGNDADESGGESDDGHEGEKTVEPDSAANDVMDGHGSLGGVEDKHNGDAKVEAVGEGEDVHVGDGPVDKKCKAKGDDEHNAGETVTEGGECREGEELVDRKSKGKDVIHPGGGLEPQKPGMPAAVQAAVGAAVQAIIEHDGYIVVGSKQGSPSRRAPNGRAPSKKPKLNSEHLKLEMITVTLNTHAICQWMHYDRGLEPLSEWRHDDPLAPVKRGHGLIPARRLANGLIQLWAFGDIWLTKDKVTHQRDPEPPTCDGCCRLPVIVLVASAVDQYVGATAGSSSKSTM
ncbi:hypothetical protein V8E36_004242 [Tilletia maclaganii]